MTYFASSTGRKFLMAISGLALFGFVIMHLLGNLQVFLGPEAINRYAAFLQGLGEGLWVARIGLLAMVGIHIWTAISLTIDNRAARPVAYAQKDYVAASYASRTMHVSGFIIVAYIVYHLLHFTFLRVHSQYGGFTDPLGRHDVYRMIVGSFQQPGIAFAYMGANLLLGMHLTHGLYSAFQSLGFVNDSVRSKLQWVARLVGYGIFLGYASIPASIFLGIVK